MEKKITRSGPGKPTNKERGKDEKYPVTTLNLTEELKKKFIDDADSKKWSYAQLNADIIEWYYEQGGKILREGKR